jgi:hypothetical protein
MESKVFILSISHKKFYLFYLIKSTPPPPGRAEQKASSRQTSLSSYNSACRGSKPGGQESDRKKRKIMNIRNIKLLA